MVYVWTKESATDNVALDFLHRQLFEAVHDLMDDSSNERGRANLSSSVQFLIDYIATHETGKDKMYDQRLCPDFLAHDERRVSFEDDGEDISRRFLTEGATVVVLAKVNTGADA